jgi:hypothetical protein
MAVLPLGANPWEPQASYRKSKYVVLSTRSKSPPEKPLEPAFLFGQAYCLDPVARPELMDGAGEIVAHGAL